MKVPNDYLSGKLEAIDEFCLCYPGDSEIIVFESEIMNLIRSTILTELNKKLLMTDELSIAVL